jgi:hypothetical protein
MNAAVRLLRLSVLCAVTGCAGQGVTRTGFIDNYDGMKPTQAHTADLIYVEPSYARAAYRSIVIEPIAWTPTPGAPPRDAATVARLEADFRSALEDALGKDFAILPATPAPPDAGVLRVRAAITNTRQAHWWINAPVTLAGIGLAVVGVPAGGAPAPDPGGASEEIEVLDGATGKRVVAIATFNNGMPWNKLGELQRFGHARRAFRIAAELLREQLTGDAPPPASRDRG